METNIQKGFQKLSLSENKIQILYNPQNLLHKSSKQHPERPERISQIVNHLKKSKYQDKLITFQQLRKQLQIQESLMDKITKQQIINVHGQHFHDFIQGMWPQGIKKTEMFINVDTYFMKDTYKAAFQAVKTGLLSVQSSIKRKDQTNICLIRPPGHHSGMKSQPHGFCFFNNVAIAANYYITKTAKKIAILDWDIHHGQGTQKIFYQRKDALYISIHRFDNAQFFPHIKESGCEYVGEKQGEGFNVNICWNLPKKQAEKQQQTCGDAQYLECFKRLVIPILKEFNPEAIFISCGFDCAQGDPIGGTKISQNGFWMMSNMIKQLQKNTFVFLEGGYNIQALKSSILAVLDGLTESEQSIIKKKQQAETNIKSFALKDIQNAVQTQKRYWKLS